MQQISQLRDEAQAEYKKISEKIFKDLEHYENEIKNLLKNFLADKD